MLAFPPTLIVIIFRFRQNKLLRKKVLATVTVESTKYIEHVVGVCCYISVLHRYLAGWNNKYSSENQYFTFGIFMTLYTKSLKASIADVPNMNINLEK